MWTQSPWKRFDCGKALIDLTLQKVVKQVDGTLVHTLKPSPEHCMDHISFEIGQYVIISTSERIITTGVLTYYKDDCVEVALDRYVFQSQCSFGIWVHEIVYLNRLS